MTLQKRNAEVEIREAGMRVTPQRRAVWSSFEDVQGSGHLTADEVHERARALVPEVSRATVYNVLAAFVEAGMLRAVESRGAVLYDPNTDPTHHHFRCRVCNRLHDVHVEGVEKLQVSSGESFIVENKTVLLGGVCPECFRKELQA